ncbi:hypothetical protein [Microcystis phage MaeS]|nr:hypothetical protein [Microcystis phage MaeS]
MADSNNRVRIDFDVNAQELQEITKAISVLDKFNKQASQVTNALNALGGSSEKNARKLKGQTDELVNLDRAMNAWSSRLKSNQSMMSSYEAAQAKLTQRLSQYGRDVKVVVDETGKLSATFKNAEGNLVTMKGSYDKATNSIKNMKTQLSTVANEVQKKAEADKKAAQEMDKLHGAALKLNRELDNQKKRYQELTRGTDLSRVLKANGGAFDAMNNSVIANATIVRASTDRNGKFTQTLRTQDGVLRSVSGYYDAANKKLVQYSESMSKAEANTRKLGSQSQTIKQLGESFGGAHQHAQSFAEAVKMGVDHILLFKVAGSIVLGLEAGFRNMLSTLILIDDQITQLARVLPETTNFNGMMEDSIRLSTELGRSLTDINEGLITFARSGFNNIDTRFLTEAATLMANVSDLTVMEGSETLTSAITLFNIKARDSVQVVNKLNEVNVSASRYSDVA